MLLFDDKSIKMARKPGKKNSVGFTGEGKDEKEIHRWQDKNGMETTNTFAQYINQPKVNYIPTN